MSHHLVEADGTAYAGVDVSIVNMRRVSLFELVVRVGLHTPKKLLAAGKLLINRNQKGMAFRFARAVDELNSLLYRDWLSIHEDVIRADADRSISLKLQVLVTIGTGAAADVSRTEKSLERQPVGGWRIVERTTLQNLRQQQTNDLWLNLPAGTVLAGNAMEQMLRPFASPQVAAVYCDEDEVDARGRRRRPFFKPAWSPLLAASGWLPLEAALVRLTAVPQSIDCTAANMNEVVCAIASSEQQIVHIPRVLLSMPDRKRTPVSGGIASKDCVPGQIHVTVIIPTRDRVDLITSCLRGLRDRTTGVSLDVIIIDNDSTEESTLTYLREAEKNGIARVVPMPGTFNFSKACNLGVSEARNEMVLLLNNDVDPIVPDWLTQMAFELQDTSVGAVGAYLLYPDGLVQHAGVTLGAGSVARHSFAFIDPTAGEDRGLLQQRRDVSAVTAACLLTTKSLWQAVGGMDEQGLAVAFNDVDYCLKLRQLSKRVVWTPHAKLWHRESVSRGSDNTAAKLARFASEEATMYRRWGTYLQADPFHNPNLSLVAEDFVLEAFPGDLSPRTSKWI